MTPAPAPVETEQQPQEQDFKALYGENFEQLPKQLVDALREQVKEFQGQERYLRRREVMRDRRNRFYERGFQHIVWNSAGSSPGFTMIAPGGQSVNASGQSVQAPRYVDDYNIFQRYLQINLAILTQVAPGIDFRPDDPSAPEDNEAAETAELYRHAFDQNNDVSQIRMNTVRMFGLSGRCVRWTRTESDPQKYGLNPDGSEKHVEVCSVYGTLETKVPILSKEQCDALYCFISDDPDVKQAKSEYPDFAEEIKAGIPGLGENAYERLARLGVLQGSRSEMLSADSYTHLTTRMRCWMRPEAFTGERYDNPVEEMAEGDEPGMTLGDKFRQLFPEGCCVTFVGDVYVGSYAESMDDHLCISFPYEGDGMNRMAIMDPMVVVQDAFNDAMNAAREVFDVGWPSTWISCEDQEYDAIVNQRAEPYAIRQKKARNGQPLEQDFFREPNPDLPATFVEFMQDLEGPLAQFILAAPPALFGAAMEDQKTASGYAQARAQAMGQQGVIYAKLQRMDAQMYYQAALCAANNPDESRVLSIPGGNGNTTTIDVGKISKGHFGAYPDEDTSFPESQSAKRATIDQVLTLIGPTPMGAQLMAVPKNLKIYLDVHGLSEIVIPEAEAYDKQMFEIEQLLKTAPVPPDPQMQDQAMIDHAAAVVKMHNSGMPDAQAPPPPQLPPTSTVPVNDWDFHQWEAAACQDWLNSQEMRRQIAQGNQAGVDNVVLHWRAHVQAAAAQMPPPMAPMPAQQGSKPSAPNPAGNLLPAATQPPGAPGMATM